MTKRWEETFYDGRRACYDISLALDLIEHQALQPRLVERRLSRSLLHPEWINPTYALRCSLRDHRLEEPGLLLLNPTLVIDGNHRLAARYLRGFETMRFYAVPRREAEVFRL